MLLAFNELGLEKQLHVIMGGSNLNLQICLKK